MKRFFFAAAAALLASIPSASATPKPSIFAGLDANHMAIVEQSFAHGVPVVLDTETCLNEGMAGYYNGRVIAICMTGNGWDEENKDTLRHEAHHLVQDCRDTYLNGRLNAVYTDPIGLAKSWLGDRRIAGILNAYAEASDHIKVMELEAFSVAAMNDPAEQVQDIKTYCF